MYEGSHYMNNTRGLVVHVMYVGNPLQRSMYAVDRLLDSFLICAFDTSIHTLTPLPLPTRSARHSNLDSTLSRRFLTPRLHSSTLGSNK